ncbi:DUF418 domain-containing protein [Phycisphaerales bacterium AB-hyl4]|uniref:DUF418 domain-containing protein n=1 Tax=Natronomicrosphaera hydrolytica TaxID=3242702 RepID=A0ABV4U5V9_9BACT
MTDPIMSPGEQRPEPVLAGERNQTLDVLRGMAILGILVLNIQSFAMPSFAYIVPTAWGDFTGANFAVWLASHLLADQKFVTIFSLLFGAGIVLMAERQQAKGLSAAGLHYRRMAWLALFGLLHAYLIWYGDILLTLALCGAAAYLVWRLPPAALVGIGLVAIAIPATCWGALGMTLSHWPDEAIAGLEHDWGPAAIEEARWEYQVYNAGWLAQMPHRAMMALYLQTFVLVFHSFWAISGLMCLGMALYKAGWLTGQASAWTYHLALGLAVLVGLPVIGLGVMHNMQRGWDATWPFVGMQFNYWGSLLVAGGWIAAAVLLVRHQWLSRVRQALSAVGQTALSNYLFQSLLCTFIFYGHGLGAFGDITRLGQLGLVLVVWSIQIALSLWWVRRYRFGPMEWLWRSMTYRRRQPMRRVANL